MQVTVIRTDGSEETHETTFQEIRRLIGAETLDTVNLRDGRIMIVDDNGWDYEVREVGPGHIAHVPTTPRRPINVKATELYRSVCKPGVTHQIAGDVAVVVDAEVADG